MPEASMNPVTAPPVLKQIGGHQSGGAAPTHKRTRPSRIAPTSPIGGSSVMLAADAATSRRSFLRRRVTSLVAKLLIRTEGVLVHGTERER